MGISSEDKVYANKIILKILINKFYNSCYPDSIKNKYMLKVEHEKIETNKLLKQKKRLSRLNFYIYLLSFIASIIAFLNPPRSNA